MALTVLEYFYRDASNYKRWARHVLAGAITPEQEAAVRAHCINAPYDTYRFFPAQLDLHDPYEDLPGSYDDDPYWCELHAFEVFPDGDAAGHESVEDFVARFLATEWNLEEAREDQQEKATWK